MKKLLLSILMFAGIQAFAQKDLVILMDSPAVNQTITAGQPFNIKYSIKNNGATDIATTDSIALGVVVSNNIVYAVPLNHGGLTAGQTKSGALNGLTLNFTSGANGVNFCLITTLRYNGNLDSNTANNITCATVNMSVTSGMEELAIAKSVNVYPNPASDVLNIEMNYDKVAKLSIFDITGKQIESISFTNGLTKLNVADYAKGIYLYELYTAENQKIKSGKFTVSH